MKTSAPWLAAALVLAASCTWAQAPPTPATAATAAPPAVARLPPPPASAPGTRPPVRKQSASEERAGAAMPGDLRPENPVVPQLKLPLGRGAADAARPNPGTIDDAMARCKATPVGPERTDCLRKARITAPAR